MKTTMCTTKSSFYISCNACQATKPAGGRFSNDWRRRTATTMTMMFKLIMMMIIWLIYLYYCSFVAGVSVCVCARFILWPLSICCVYGWMFCVCFCLFLLVFTFPFRLGQEKYCCGKNLAIESIEKSPYTIIQNRNMIRCLFFLISCNKT